MATRNPGSQAAYDWLSLPNAPRGKDLAEMAGLDRDSLEAKNFIRAVQLFTSEKGRRNTNMSAANLELLAEAAKGSLLAVHGSVILPRETDPKKWTPADTEVREIRLDLDPALAITEGYNAAYYEALAELIGDEIDDLLQSEVEIDDDGIDWQL